MKKTIIGLCLLLMSSGSFGLSIKQYQEEKLSHNDLVIYVLGIYDGILPYFCPPDMPLTGENLIDILDKTLEENKWFVEKVPNVALSYPLQIGLINTFPCKD